ncbi:CPBP family intramembrane glutamic endopeptidase [Arsenicicoccus cauae]|nr:CPBP family intramembrane glutamic endopeptidase [Arsenicicoccus cauae]
MTYPYATAPPRPRIPDLPPRATEYHQLLRGPRHRWWRPLLSVVIVVASLLMVVIAVSGIAAAVVVGSGGDLEEWMDSAASGRMSPSAFLSTNLMLAALIPVSLFAIWVGHTVDPRWVQSVTGRFRWGWFARCLAVLTPLWLAYLAVGTLVDGLPDGGRSADWVALLAIMLLTTPLQCAGEELLFRGWVLQSLGSWFSHRWVALAVPTVVSCLAFGAAHGSSDPWTFADLAVFAVTACLLTWRTGGLEAAIALHVVNNMLVMALSLALGGFDEGFIDGDTKGSPLAVMTSVVIMAIAYALVAWQARRVDLQRRSTPQIPPPPVVPLDPGPVHPVPPVPPVRPVAQPGQDGGQAGGWHPPYGS